MSARKPAVDEPASDLQAWQFRIFSPVRLGGAPWRRHFNFDLMIVRSRRQGGPRGCAARSQRMTQAVIGRSAVLRMPISRSRLGTLPLKSPKPMLSSKNFSNFQEDR